MILFAKPQVLLKQFILHQFKHMQLELKQEKDYQT